VFLKRNLFNLEIPRLRNTAIKTLADLGVPCFGPAGRDVVFLIKANRIASTPKLPI
jgi:hypothetical protein